MFLHTPLYLLFFGVVFVLNWTLNWISLTRRPRIYLLLFASYVFYATFDLRFVAILLLLTVTTYWLGRLIATSPNASRFLWGGVAFNLAIMGIFKSANFFLDSATAILQGFGIHTLPPALTFVLPIGISFFTFQSISYLVEVRRNKLLPVKSFVDLALYLAFFPKLVAGPLVRPAQFLQQIAVPPARLHGNELERGFMLLVIGLIKKILIADTLANLAGTAFRAALSGNSQGFPSPLYWQGFYLFAFQIYADFSGYTDLARASAILLGFSLPENFNQPYFAATIGAFWNRWHMSLTEWFREYVYFPLSRRLLSDSHRRHPELVQVASNLITMTLIGLWHGAAWTFIVWGLWHGILISIERLLHIKPIHPWQRILGAIITFHLVALGWVLFRADSFESAARFLAGLFSFSQLAWVSIFMPVVLVVAGVTFAIDLLMKPVSSKAIPWHYHVVIVASIVVILGLWMLNFSAGNDARPFLYGRF